MQLLINRIRSTVVADPGGDTMDARPLSVQFLSCTFLFMQF